MSEHQYLNLLQAIPDIVYMLDAEGRFVYINDAIRILGYEPSDLIGKHFSRIIHPDDVPRVSRVEALRPLQGVATGDENAPKLFDERRSGKRMTRNLELRLRPGDKQRRLSPGLGHLLRRGELPGLCPARVRGPGSGNRRHNPRHNREEGTPARPRGGPGVEGSPTQGNPSPGEEQPPGRIEPPQHPGGDDPRRGRRARSSSNARPRSRPCRWCTRSSTGLRSSRASRWSPTSSVSSITCRASTKLVCGASPARSRPRASSLDLDDAIPVALIVNELVSNCMKHAFPEMREGKIRVSLRKGPPSASDDDSGRLLLEVEDDGIGSEGSQRRGRRRSEGGRIGTERSSLPASKCAANVARSRRPEPERDPCPDHRSPNRLHRPDQLDEAAIGPRRGRGVRVGSGRHAD